MKRLIMIVISGLLLAACGQAAAEASLISEGVEPEGFTRADGPRAWDFPADYGPHPDYQTEWWYYTGNLTSPDGRHFGYQMTWFRRAVEPAPERTERESDWAVEQIYLAHFAVTDVGGGTYQAFERFSRGAADLAGAQGDPYRVWLEDWYVETIGPETYAMFAEAEGVTLDVEMVSRKEPVLQGEQGYSQKGPEPGNASYYNSLTRLETTGTITVDGETFEVSGMSWKDHEFSTSALSDRQIGWDWFSIQLDDGTDLMFYHVRREDGSIDRLSKGSLSDAQGNTRVILYREDDYIIDVTDTWTSRETGATYPAGWEVTIPSADMTITIEPLLADQELNVSYAYWEGAVRVSGTHNGQPVSGFGYVELTGYASSMEDQF
ncbi:MAG: lipocalin-like domain-containing protein [Anaerolineae bacterium]